MDFSLSSFLGHLDKDQVAEPSRNDDKNVISNDVSIKSNNFYLKEKYFHVIITISLIICE
jgi:hypothetical protein